MPRYYMTLTLDDAKHMLAAAEVKAETFGIGYNIAVVDAGAICWPSRARTAPSSEASTLPSTRRRRRGAAGQPVRIDTFVVAVSGVPVTLKGSSLTARDVADLRAQVPNQAF